LPSHGRSLRSLRELEKQPKKLTSDDLAVTNWPASGYVPLSEEAYWIASRGSTVGMDLLDTQPWKSAFDQLLEHIKSGSLEVFGRRRGSGIPEKIPSQVFSGIKISYPFEDPSNKLLSGQGIYLVCWFTNEGVEGEHWQSGMNDQIWGPGYELHWSQLQIKSSHPGSQKRSSNRARVECTKWLTDQMRGNSERPMPKQEFLAQAKVQFSGLSERSFEIAWKDARRVTGSGWGNPGRPKSSR
jgi:hypothetical protein